MRSSITIFLLGLVLGSTLGIGGIWTQVVKPAYDQIDKMETEHGVLKGALDEAGETLREVVEELRSEATPEGEGPTPLTGANILPRTNAGSVIPNGISPTRPGTATEPAAETPRRSTRALADRLDKVASRLEAARKKD